MFLLPEAFTQQVIIGGLLPHVFLDPGCLILDRGSDTHASSASLFLLRIQPQGAGPGLNPSTHGEELHFLYVWLLPPPFARLQYQWGI